MRKKIMQYAFNELKVFWLRVISLWIQQQLRSWNHSVPSFIKLTSNYNYDVLVTVLSFRILSYLTLTTALCGNFVSTFLVIKILRHREVNFSRVMHQSSGGTRTETQVLRYQSPCRTCQAETQKCQNTEGKKGVFNFQEWRWHIFKNH